MGRLAAESVEAMTCAVIGRKRGGEELMGKLAAESVEAKTCAVNGRPYEVVYHQKANTLLNMMLKPPLGRLQYKSPSSTFFLESDAIFTNIY
ncbi:hypothetical protein VNO77_33397 [Canavalia gladiata]|uniref:Uncharacterized protein n=1 Tax=Canavalia gladiata TaxID=3824 RepID=A0AAN9PYV5_CANGL